jgi:sugar lactone lactonase YvrE
MNRLSIAFLLCIAGLVTAQDMPLHEIIKPGEEWRPHSGVFSLRSPKFSIPTQLKEPTCTAVALGGSTVLVADAGDRYIWAFRIEKDGQLGPGDRYCRLRVRGDDRLTKTTLAENYRADPSAMTVDGAGRAYVATNLGIQVFDPTGRLCGVFTSPPGRVAAMVFDGDRLFAIMGEKAYVRQMNATGK